MFHLVEEILDAWRNDVFDGLYNLAAVQIVNLASSHFFHA